MMKKGTGELIEVYLENGLTGGRILCPQILMPAPGQYLLAQDSASASPLPAPIFSAGPIPGGFLVAPPIPETWRPGNSLFLRGPLGYGFSLPTSAQRVALVTLGETFARLKPLLAAGLVQEASVVLVSDLDLTDLSPEIEIQPLATLAEIVQWADYVAIDLTRESLPELRQLLGLGDQAGVRFARPGPWRAGEAQVLVVTPMPCGGIAECGICAIKIRRGWKMACKDGPVFNLNELI